MLTQEDAVAAGPTEAWIYIGAGRTTGGNLSRQVDAGKVGTSGSLGTLTYLAEVNQPPTHAGYGYGAANNKLFIFGGKDGVASQGGYSAVLCATTGCLPSFQIQGGRGWNALGTGNNLRLQIYPGSTQESAFFFLVGGHDGTNTLSTSEQTVQ
jgi:hypothetical protein